MGHFHRPGHLARLDRLIRPVEPLSRCVCLLLLLLAACGPGPRSAPEAGAAPRIISLAPHLTELAFDAGAGERLVGVSEYSDYPEAARSVPRIGDAFNLDFERIAELQPDMVLVWASGTSPALRSRLAAMGLTLVVMETRRLEDIPLRLVELGDLAGDPALARMRAREFEQAMTRLRKAAADARPVRTFYQISADPLYTVGGHHYISEVIGLCGGENIFADLDIAAAAVDMEAVLARRPQLVLVDERQLTAARAMWTRFGDALPPDVVTLSGIDADLVARPTLRLARGAARICAVIDEARADRSGARGRD